MICATCAQEVATGAERCPRCDGDGSGDAAVPEPFDAAQHHPWTKPTESPPLEHRHAHHTGRSKPTTCAHKRDVSNTPDVPMIRRPEELSQELSQAHNATIALLHQQRTKMALERVLLVFVTAVIAGLATYLALVL